MVFQLTNWTEIVPRKRKYKIKLQLASRSKLDLFEVLQVFAFLEFSKFRQGWVLVILGRQIGSYKSLMWQVTEIVIPHFSSEKVAWYRIRTNASNAVKKVYGLA